MCASLSFAHGLFAQLLMHPTNNYMLVRESPLQEGKPVVSLLWPPSLAGAGSALTPLSFKPLLPYLRRVLPSLFQRLKWSTALGLIRQGRLDAEYRRVMRTLDNSSLTRTIIP